MSTTTNNNFKKIKMRNLKNLLAILNNCYFIGQTRTKEGRLLTFAASDFSAESINRHISKVGLKATKNKDGNFEFIYNVTGYTREEINAAFGIK